jgi:DNA modification methylase
MIRPYYDEGGITIYHGDCLDVLPHIDPADVDLLLTDPPYGIDWDASHDRFNGGRNYAAVEGDAGAFDPTPLLRFSRCVLWGANHYASRLPDRGSWLVWDKRDGRCVENLLSDAELAWCSFPTPVRTFRNMWMAANRSTERGFHVHPTQKPVALMRWIVARWTKPGDLVLDPYMGSGPIAQACYDLGRRYIGIELVEDYCAIAVRRLGQGVLDFGVMA